MVPMPLPTTVCAIFRRASIRPFAQSGCSRAKRGCEDQLLCDQKESAGFFQDFALGKELGVPVHADHYMMPAVRERTLPFDAQVRLHPEDAAALAFQALKLQLDADIFRQYVRESVRRVNDPAFPRGDGHISCLAGNCSFFINWQGRLFPCVMLSELSAPVFDLGFLAAWERFPQSPESFA